MKRDDLVCVIDMLESIAKIESYVSGIDEGKFRADSGTQDAVLRRLEIIGEASKNLSKSFKDNRPSVPWKKMAGLRDVLIHSYFGVSIERTWKVVKEDMKSLKAELQKAKTELQKK